MGSGPTKITVKSLSDTELEYFVEAEEACHPFCLFQNISQSSIVKQPHAEEIIEMCRLAFENPHILSNPLLGFHQYPSQRDLTATDG